MRSLPQEYVNFALPSFHSTLTKRPMGHTANILHAACVRKSPKIAIGVFGPNAL